MAVQAALVGEREQGMNPSPKNLKLPDQNVAKFSGFRQNGRSTVKKNRNKSLGCGIGRAMADATPTDRTVS
tara:strand:+ start:388 stop:600 length:213 start_codon:yes stop_codon:yes gene_type:complete